MVNNGQQINMKRIALIVSLALVSTFGINNAHADNDTKESTTQLTTSSDNYSSDPQAYVSDVDYDLEKGIIQVWVTIKNGDGDCHRVKVTPKDQISGVVVEGSLYVNAGSTCGNGCVTFHCYSGKEGDAPMCRAYTFNAEIVD